jgi:hypothetical protein
MELRGRSMKDLFLILIHPFRPVLLTWSRGIRTLPNLPDPMKQLMPFQYHGANHKLNAQYVSPSLSKAIVFGSCRATISSILTKLILG